MKRHFTTPVGIARMLAVLLFVLVPFHAFLTVWFASNLGHYTLVRLWSALIVGLLVVIGTAWVARDTALRRLLRREPVIAAAAFFLAVLVLWTIGGLAFGRASLDAALLGFWLHARYLLFFMAVYLLGRYDDWLPAHWRRVILVPALLVAGFAAVQYFLLPADFLRHFGYSITTIEPFETINNNPDFIRVSSTLRGPNPLGAYMVVAMVSVAGLLIARLRWWRGWAALLVLFLALLVSFSRSAWLGLVVALAVLVALSIRTKRQKRVAGLTVLTVSIVAIFAGLLFRDSAGFQNAIFHTEDASQVALSSNDQRESALRQGVRDTLYEPFGRGVGSAGPASVHNDAGPVRLAENYVLQIGQEMGWLGVAAYGALVVVLVRRLWELRSEALPRILLASFIGLLLVNMLSHAWTDDTLAFVWWGMLGIALSAAASHRLRAGIR